MFDGQQVIVCVHHHPIRAPHKRVDALREMKDAEAFRAACSDAGVSLVLHGHNHFADARRIGSGDGFVVVGLSSSSTDRQDRPERRGQVGMYEWDGSSWNLQWADYDASSGSFGDWRTIQPVG